VVQIEPEKEINRMDRIGRIKEKQCSKRAFSFHPVSPVHPV
jgi:hypothetical protein